MTPEERARAAEINAEISAMIRGGRRPPKPSLVHRLSEAPGAKPAPAIIEAKSERPDHTFRNTILICVTLTLNVAGFVGYSAYKEHREREEIEAALQRADHVMSQAVKAGTDAAKQMSNAFNLPNPPPKPVPLSARDHRAAATRHLTSKLGASPNVQLTEPVAGSSKRFRTGFDHQGTRYEITTEEQHGQIAIVGVASR